MRRWLVPALEAVVLVGVVLVVGPWIRSPFGSRPVDAPPANPPAVAAGPVTFELLPSQTVLPAGEESTVFLAARITAPEAAAAAVRPPLNLAVVLDKSGSMASANKIDFARKAAKLLVDRLESRDVLSIVVYDSEVELLVPAAPLTDPNRVRSAIDRIEPSGSTNLSGGLQRGCEEVLKNFGKEKVNRVLLMTDGLANNGETNPSRLEAMVREWNRKGVTVSTFGMGAEFNEDLLVALAETGSGRYHFIESPEQMAGIYAGELKDLMKIAAKGAVLRVEPGEGFEVAEAYSYSMLREGRSVLVNLGDLYAGQTRKVVLRLTGAAGKAKSSASLATGQLSYRDVATEKPGAATATVSIEWDADPARAIASRDMKVLEVVESVQAAQSFDAAMKLVQSGKRDEAKKMITSQIRLSEERNAREFKSATLGLQIRKFQDSLQRIETERDSTSVGLAVKQGRYQALEASR